jgi:P27 family predicted phage terminase small subunit
VGAGGRQTGRGPSFRARLNCIREGGKNRRGGGEMSNKTIKPKKIIKDKEAKKLFQILIQELEKDNNLNDRTLMIVDNIVLLEQLKQEHMEDIKQRGVMELFKNGSQEMFRENKSVDKILKIVEQQRKLQAELKLTPASEKKVAEVVEVDDFEKF